MKCYKDEFGNLPPGVSPDDLEPDKYEEPECPDAEYEREIEDEL